jgi:Skp family chaperone for outer membrane proteins
VTIGTAKIAWIYLDAVIQGTDEGKREFGEIQKWVDRKNQELQGLTKELETLQNQLNVQGAKLTDEAREDLEAQIEFKTTGLERFRQDTNKEIEGRRGRATNYLGRRMLPVVEKVSREKGLSAVQYLNPGRDAWVDPSLIITDEVIRAYNAAHPVTSSVAPPPRKP